MDNVETDSDDSAFIFELPGCKRKPVNKLNNKNKLAKLSNESTSKSLGVIEEACTSKTSVPIIEKPVKAIPGKAEDSTLIEILKPTTGIIEAQKYICPLCSKAFDNKNSHVSHMKQCAKKRKLTTEQLLEAIDNKCTISAVGSKPGVSEKKDKVLVNDDDDERNYELALSLAMARSLEGPDSQAAHSSSASVIEAQKTTLEKFGFTSSGPAKPQHGRRKGKMVLLCNTALKLRTKEERERLMTEKAAIVLLDEHSELKEDSSRPPDDDQLDAPQLWRRSEEDAGTSWYVESLRGVLTEGEDAAKEKDSPPLSGESIDAEISKVNLSGSSVAEDWRRLINNAMLSDVRCETRDKLPVHLHSVVVLARCPQLLQTDWPAVFQRHDHATVSHCLEFLYCGVLGAVKRSQVDALFNLAVDLNYENLKDVLSKLRGLLTVETLSGSSEGVIPSSWSPERDVVDLTQSSHGSPLSESDHDTAAVDKSYFSFIAHEKKRKRIERLREEEEEKENIMDIEEMSKIESFMKQQTEMQEMVMDTLRREEEEANNKNRMELDKIYRMSHRSSNESDTDLFEESGKGDDKGGVLSGAAGSHKEGDDCILLSSDSERSKDGRNTFDASTDDENTERQSCKSRPPPEHSFDVPYFDPYEHECVNFDFSPPPVATDARVSPSQSLLSPKVSVETPLLSTPKRPSPSQSSPTKAEVPAYCSTPLSARNDEPVMTRSRRSLVGAGRSRSGSEATPSRASRLTLRGAVLRRRSSKDRVAALLTDSIMKEFNSTLGGEGFPVGHIEVTPGPSPGVDYSEPVTPLPDFSGMEEALLKTHLDKYGLKKGLSRNKAKKLLRHIYEELHPVMNTRTGKIVKFLSGQKKGKRAKRTKNDPVKAKRKISAGRSEEGDGGEEGSSEGGEGGGEGLEVTSDEEEPPATQSAVALPEAVETFLYSQPEVRRQVVGMVPVRLDQFRDSLQRHAGCRFKLTALADYLDDQCITYRTEAQEKRNEKRNRKASPKKSPRKQKSTSPKKQSTKCHTVVSME